MENKCFLFFALAVFLITVSLTNGLMSDSRQRVLVEKLSIQESDQIIGSVGWMCAQQGGGCTDNPIPCGNPGQDCSGSCTIPAQDWECDFSVFYKNGCCPDPPKSCGTQQTGVCDQNRDCWYSGTTGCGTYKNCHNT